MLECSLKVASPEMFIARGQRARDRMSRNYDPSPTWPLIYHDESRIAKSLSKSQK